MADMLVKLYTLPDITDLIQRLKDKNIEIRQAIPSERQTIVTWAGARFNPVWAAECDVAVTNRPVSCYIAAAKGQPKAAPEDAYDQPDEQLIGFACYDATRRGMFGPEGVLPEYQGWGIGKALLITCLQAMYYDRYAYAVIGWAGPVDFYRKAVGATIIEGSEPGIYRGPLRG